MLLSSSPISYFQISAHETRLFNFFCVCICVSMLFSLLINVCMQHSTLNVFAVHNTMPYWGWKVLKINFNIFKRCWIRLPVPTIREQPRNSNSSNAPPCVVCNTHAARSYFLIICFGCVCMFYFLCSSFTTIFLCEHKQSTRTAHMQHVTCRSKSLNITSSSSRMGLAASSLLIIINGT